MMVIDENLPFQVGPLLNEPYLHVSSLSASATDSMIWEQAKEKNWTILTKDIDFFNRLLIHGTPPKVIWIRLGNMKKKDLLSALRERWASISIASAHHDLVQVHPHHLEQMNFPKPYPPTL